MPYLKLIPLAIVFWLIHAQASTELIGQHLSLANPKDNPALCKITIVGKGSCSGTLVTSNEIYTAAHCFGEDFMLQFGSTPNVKVECGGANAGFVSHVTLPSGRNVWQNGQINPELNNQDFAVIHLSGNSKQLPIPAAAGPEHYFANGKLLPNVKCRLMGFGQTDVNGRRNIGNLVQADLSNGFILDLTSLDLIVLRPAYVENVAMPVLATSADHGDSGGALLCTAPDATEELVGVILSYTTYGQDRPDQRRTNVMNPVWIHADHD